jgi:hypothetical protein
MSRGEPLFQRPKRGLYVAYDHARDGAPYASFARHFSSLFRLERDNSLERELGAEDAEAHVRALQEGPMATCSCALVLCGASTHLSAFVDWEIKAALDRRMGLIAVILPANPARENGEPLLPERLRRNFDSGFAVVVRAGDLIEGRVDLGARVEFATARMAETIDNALPLMRKDG